MKERLAISGFEARFPSSGFDLSFLHLDLEPGGITVVSGPSGSGKSTLGHAFAGLLPYMGAEIKGTLHLDGSDVSMTDKKAWRNIRGRAVRWIPQEPARVFTPILPVLPQMLEGVENPDTHDKRLDRLLQVMGLPDREALESSYPFELSGGMLQRAASISAFLPGPALVVADEPTAHLDPPGSLLLAKIVTTLAGHTGTAVLWITHDLRLAAAVADRVIFLSEGRIETDGAPDELLDPFGEKTIPMVRASARLALPI